MHFKNGLNCLGRAQCLLLAQRLRSSEESSSLSPNRQTSALPHYLPVTCTICTQNKRLAARPASMKTRRLSIWLAPSRQDDAEGCREDLQAAQVTLLVQKLLSCSSDFANARHCWFHI